MTHIRLLEQDKHHCLPLQRAYKKYGDKSFYIAIFEVDANLRIHYEQEIINNNKNYIYNTCQIAGCPSVRFSLETRKKISAASSNRIVSEETKRKISQALTGRKRGIEFSLARSAAMKGKKPLYINKNGYSRCKKVVCIDTGAIYESAASASRGIGVAISGVGKAIKYQTRSGGHYWKYL